MGWIAPEWLGEKRKTPDGFRRAFRVVVKFPDADAPTSGHGDEGAAGRNPAFLVFDLAEHLCYTVFAKDQVQGYNNVDGRASCVILCTCS
jgi:hypothetical protein